MLSIHKVQMYLCYQNSGFLVPETGPLIWLQLLAKSNSLPAHKKSYSSPVSFTCSRYWPGSDTGPSCSDRTKWWSKCCKRRNKRTNVSILFCRYDPEKDQWQLVAPMLTRRIGVGVAVINRLLYAVGGFDGANRLSSCECYNPERDEWRTMASMNTVRSGAGKEATLNLGNSS